MGKDAGLRPHGLRDVAAQALLLEPAPAKVLLVDQGAERLDAHPIAEGLQVLMRSNSGALPLLHPLRQELADGERAGLLQVDELAPARRPPGGRLSLPAHPLQRQHRGGRGAAD
eukprot:9753200-Lingulodinium_polyedra.AAC.1